MTPERPEQNAEQGYVEWPVVRDIALGVGGVSLFAYGLEVGSLIAGGVGVGMAVVAVVDIMRNDGQQRSDTV